MVQNGPLIKYGFQLTKGVMRLNVKYRLIFNALQAVLAMAL